MFKMAKFFNQDLSQWDVSKVTKTQYMFWGATSFNQDLSQWDVSKVTNTEAMFADATSFSQNLCSWGSDIQDAKKEWMFYGSGCPTASIDEGKPSDTSVCHSCYIPPLVVPPSGGWITLGQCEGNCKIDACDEGLSCFTRIGNEEVSGCQSGGPGDVSDYGYCVKQSSSIDESQDSSSDSIPSTKSFKKSTRLR